MNKAAFAAWVTLRFYKMVKLDELLGAFPRHHHRCWQIKLSRSLR